jgi:DNA-binding CsgD family transcriptional regulator
MKQNLRSTAVTTRNRPNPCNSPANKVQPSVRREPPSLTAEEAIVLRALVGGKTDKQICGELRIPLGLFYRLLRDLHEKAGVTDRLSLIVWALKRMEIGERRARPRDGYFRSA